MPDEQLKRFTKICEDFVATPEEKRERRLTADFLEACQFFEDRQIEVPLKFRIMRAALFAKDTGEFRLLHLEIGEHYDMQHAAKRGVPRPVAQAIANHFRAVRKRGW